MTMPRRMPMLSARLPYLFACCRFAHYLKCMVRDKVGSTMTRTQIATWLSGWLIGYVDGSPDTSTEEFKAAHPLADARVVVTDADDMPGMYEAKFFLQPHYQLEGTERHAAPCVAAVNPDRSDRGRHIRYSGDSQWISQRLTS